jgi:hypothetical protein
MPDSAKKRGPYAKGTQIRSARSQRRERRVKREKNQKREKIGLSALPSLPESSVASFFKPVPKKRRLLSPSRPRGTSQTSGSEEFQPDDEHSTDWNNEDEMDLDEAQIQQEADEEDERIYARQLGGKLEIDDDTDDEEYEELMLDRLVTTDAREGDVVMTWHEVRASVMAKLADRKRRMLPRERERLEWIKQYTNLVIKGKKRIQASFQVADTQAQDEGVSMARRVCSSGGCVVISMLMVRSCRSERFFFIIAAMETSRKRPEAEGGQEGLYWTMRPCSKLVGHGWRRNPRAK